MVISSAYIAEGTGFDSQRHRLPTGFSNEERGTPALRSELCLRVFRKGGLSFPLPFLLPPATLHWVAEVSAFPIRKLLLSEFLFARSGRLLNNVSFSTPRFTEL